MMHTLLPWLKAAMLLSAFLFYILKILRGGFYRLANPGQARFRRHYRRIHQGGVVAGGEAIKPIRRTRPKPAWVRREVLRLKALMPDGSCRKIRDAFNRRFARERKMAVGKTFVSETIRKHLHEIQVLRKQIKNAKPRPVPVNWIWSMDLTGKTDSQGKTHMLLGILDHGSRAALCLQVEVAPLGWTGFPIS